MYVARISHISPEIRKKTLARSLLFRARIPDKIPHSLHTALKTKTHTQKQRLNKQKNEHLPNPAKAFLKVAPYYGTGAAKRNAHLAEHAPNAVLQAMTVAGAVAPAVAPQVAPAAA
jgi:hypothetical protein